jgi:hypothetical protein
MEGPFGARVVTGVTAIECAVRSCQAHSSRSLGARPSHHRQGVGVVPNTCYPDT